MPKCQFSPAQVQHLDSYLPEYIARLDARAPTKELTLWKQATATKILASPEFSDLDLAKHPRAKWFEMIVRKYTNYLHQVYKKAHPETVSASDIIKANPLLKFSSVLSGRQLFARDMHDEIVAASKQHVIDKGTNEAGTYQTVLKTMWDGLDADKKIEWDARAEEECGDVAVNQEEFHTNIHQALRGLCQSGIVGDAEMLLFYAFREPETGDLKAGTRADLAESIHGHSTHNKNNFGGDELEQTYGVPWAKFADGVIPRPVVEVPGSISIIVTSDGVVIFPSIDLDTIPPLSLRHLLQEYFEQCWIRGNSCTLPIPWAQVVLDPSKFYDTEKFAFPLALKDPQTFTIFETLAIGEFLNANTSNNATPFYFKSDVPEESGRLPDSAPLPPPPLPHTHQINIPPPGSQLTTPAQSASLGSPPTDPARSETLPPYQDVPPPGPESPPSRTSPSPPPQPRKGGKRGKKRAREAKNPQDQGHEDGSRKKRKDTVSEGQDHDTAVNTRRRSSRQNALPAQTAGTSNLQEKIETKPGKNGPKPRYKGWVVLSESSSDEL
ncbi:hypothetical protein B0H10DRAFT_2195526 [Mycena sp. CBHHK59/15]|nr:hypothetical protein B0H10DRAFT_2202653 [Mycena sp. CBHHK59/15]KAJ6548050.1 hypothetical protein B0H10DRAFT_2202657 [Mycena sp. CBHHK59/15]KAJ6552369.1 hypothetical protein B0H10DRAFT_2202073 [Mycena sp. CBHHK59/15]KAJ6605152.1 hypothetical protein B0H10DRAFT_2195526 [Mycena sp. CBHHK59/15]